MAIIIIITSTSFYFETFPELFLTLTPTCLIWNSRKIQNSKSSKFEKKLNLIKMCLFVEVEAERTVHNLQM